MDLVRSQKTRRIGHDECGEGTLDGDAECPDDGISETTNEGAELVTDEGGGEGEAR